MHEPIVESSADKVAKVRIPGRNQTDASMFVNAKQARRILIMRQKRVKKFLKAEQNMQINAQKLGKLVADQILSTSKSFGRFTKVRAKDQVRSRVAFARKRENGLFVSKRRELELAGNMSDDPDTDDPD